MSTGPRRDADELREGIARWVASHGDLVPGPPASGPPPPVTALVHAEGGLANETVLVELGPGHPGLALRLPPLVATFPDYELATQATVQNMVAAAGIPAPAPTVFVEDPRWLGTPFLVMPRIGGFIPGPAPVLDPAITGASPQRQRRWHDGLIDTLADLHAVDWEAGGLGAVLREGSWETECAHWAHYVEWAGGDDPLPVLLDGLAWCRDHPPRGGAGSTPPVLLWGDARLGNLVFDSAGTVQAVLDWDLATIGPAGMDLGWSFGLDAMMERLFGRRVPGFPERAEALARYQERCGHEVVDLGRFEVFALVRALAVNDRHQRMGEVGREDRDGRARRAGRTENPMVAALRTMLDAAG